MYSVECDKDRRIFIITVAGHLSGAEVTQSARELGPMLENAPEGFAVLADVRRIESTGRETAREIGKVMDLFAAKKVGLVVRIIPDHHKDIGLNILSQFHYGPEVEVATVTNLADAITLLFDAG